MAIDVTDAEFESKVINRSKIIPVVVDLWAPWCGPCRQLAPVLEGLAEEKSGEFELVKINVDENPQVASSLGAQSIPLVIGFRDGKPMAKFLGVQPAGKIREFLEQLVPSRLEKYVSAAEQALKTEKLDECESLLTQAELIDAKHNAVRSCRAELFLAREQPVPAIEILSLIPSNGHDDVAKRLSKARLMEAANSDIEHLAATVDLDDTDSLITYGRALAGKGEHRKALEILLKAVLRDPAWDDGAARKAMLDLFGVMGRDDPLTKSYRAKLSSALF